MRDKRANRRLADLAAHQYGVVTVGQLAAFGVDQRAVWRWVQAGRLHGLHRGVYAVGHARLSKEGRWLAAALAGGAGAALSHRSAAALWEIRPVPSGSVEITVPGDGGRRRRSNLIVHRSLTLTPNAVTECRGIPVTTPARTIEDLRRVLPPDQLRTAIREAEGLRLGVGEQPGFEPDLARSELERRFLALCRRHGLPTPAMNARAGPFEVDFVWRDRRLIVEVDGYRYHRTRSAFEADRARDARLKVLGYDVLRFTHRQLTDDADASLATLRVLLRRGAG